MKKKKFEQGSRFRKLNIEEMCEIRGGLCLFPGILGQKLGEKLVDFLRRDQI